MARIADTCVWDTKVPAIVINIGSPPAYFFLMKQNPTDAYKHIQANISAEDVLYGASQIASQNSENLRIP